MADTDFELREGGTAPGGDRPEAAGDIEAREESGRNRLSRLVLVGVLLLLLLLCVITTVTDVLIITPPATRKVIARNLECLQCHVELIPQFALADVHQPFSKRQCTTCHTRHGRETVTVKSYSPSQRWERVRTLIEWLPLRLACEIGSTPGALIGGGGNGKTETSSKKEKGKDSHLTMPETELCWMCHGNIGVQLSFDYQHAPFKGGYCTSCHNPHASPNAALLNLDARDLCVTCHPVGKWMGRSQLHPPAANRYCLACHHPHASNFKGILKARQRELCFTCHPTVASLSMKAVQHYPFAYDNCTGCHEPHGSDYPPLLIKNQPALCYTCHPQIAKDFLKPSHHPVGTVTLNCGDCHNPHATDYRYLLSAGDNRFCYGCHRLQIGVTYEPSAHRGVLCIRCHSPHGTEIAPLLRRANPPLCLECHGWIDHPNTHPFDPTYFDTHAGKPLTCTSTCHNPHGTGNPFMVVEWRCPADGQCLQCHKWVGIRF